MTPEQIAREHIDKLLSQAGWTIQNVGELNLGASLGVAVREYPTNSGPADYLLFVDRKVVGFIEAKKKGATLSRVSEQTYKYADNLPYSDVLEIALEQIKEMQNTLD